MLNIEIEVVNKCSHIYGIVFSMSPHCILELSTREWVRIKYKYVHLTDYDISNDCNSHDISYSHIDYVNNTIPTKNRFISNGKQI